MGNNCPRKKEKNSKCNYQYQGGYGCNLSPHYKSSNKYNFFLATQKQNEIKADLFIFYNDLKVHLEHDLCENITLTISTTTIN
mmetsp:Transcript_9257/g.11556  ORF Transcript_9257/g.11556 Transcript_9257/m.11556 type:complete len:83 (+) Transcript_9257:218-466(+)